METSEEPELSIEEAIAKVNQQEAEVFEKFENANLPAEVKEEFLAEARLSFDLQREIYTMAARVKNGEEVTYGDLAMMYDAVGERHGHLSGMPVPYIPERNEDEHPLRLAERAPLARSRATQYRTERAEHWERLLEQNVINSWDTPEWTITIVRTEKGPMAIKEPNAGIRLRKLLTELGLRHDIGTMTAKAEFTAIKSLEGMITKNQFDQYVLSNCFIERSKRSDLVYMFRKGRPTLAMSWHGENGKEGGRCISALCFHPIGFYGNTHVGVMTPTDEVIAALLMMRGDEHRFWKDSGQWSAIDPRSGI